MSKSQGPAHRLYFLMGGAAKNLWHFFFLAVYHNLKPKYVKNVNEFDIYVRADRSPRNGPRLESGRLGFSHFVHST